MHRSKVAGLAALLCSITSATLGAAQANAAEGAGSVQVGVHGSTLGLGVCRIRDSVKVRDKDSLL